MVKLIRMVTDDSNGFFESQINSNIVIEPDSKIGLLSFSGALAPIEGTIADNKILYTLTDLSYNRPNRVAVVPSGIYTQNNYNTLLEGLETNLNNQNYINVNSTNEELGCQYRVNMQSAKCVIEYRLAYNANTIDEYYRLNKTEQPSPLIFGINSTDYPVNSITSYQHNLTCPTNICKSIGYFTVQISKLAITTGTTLKDNGFIIGLSKTNLNEINPNDFSEDMIDWAIGVASTDNGQSYKIFRQENGTATDLGEVPSYVAEGDDENTELIVLKDGGSIKLLYSYLDQGNIEIDTLHVYEDVVRYIDTPLYPFSCVKTNDTGLKLKLQGATLDPYSLPLDEEDITTSTFINPCMIQVNPTLPPLSRINLGDAKSFREFFGFTTPSDGIYQQTRAESQVLTKNLRGSYKVVADESFRPELGTTSFILEINNINLETYDSSQKQRKNILSSLIINTEGDALNKDDGGVIFLDISNKERVDLRNVKLRLVNQNYEKVNLVGKSVATILLADKSESSF